MSGEGLESPPLRLSVKGHGAILSWPAGKAHHERIGMRSPAYRCARVNVAIILAVREAVLHDCLGQNTGQ